MATEKLSPPLVFFSVAYVFVLLSSDAAATEKPAKFCPSGSTMMGGAPPQDVAQWCVAPDLLGRQRKNGPSKTWDTKGVLRVTGEYVDGERHGAWVWFDEKGRVSEESRFHFGKIVSNQKAAGASQSAVYADQSGEREGSVARRATSSTPALNEAAPTAASGETRAIRASANTGNDRKAQLAAFARELKTGSCIDWGAALKSKPAGPESN